MKRSEKRREVGNGGNLVEQASLGFLLMMT